MKTLTEYNEERGYRVADTKGRQGANLACDVCGGELFYKSSNIINTSNPPTRWVQCSECGERFLALT